MSVTLHHGDCLDVLRELPDNSFDSVATDPPYALSFMGREWDSHATPAAFQQWCEQWARECLRVLKPGGHMLAFGGTRTWHRLACAVEDAGFEVRDSIAWLHSQGFPKSRNVGKEVPTFEGWGTALKPAFEPIVVARKPLAGTVADNVATHGTGALNIDGCRVATTDPFGGGGSTNGSPFAATYELGTGFRRGSELGRWPANVLLSEDQAAELDRQSGTLTSGVLAAHHARAPKDAGILGAYDAVEGERGYGDSGGASRFFPTFRYQAKAPTSERPKVDGVAHPTVKPLTLMRWLVRLVTPPGGTVLEPFAGSGTTIEACVLEGFHCIAIERDATYLPLIAARLGKA